MMFGFDETIEFKRAPIQDVKKCLKDMVALIDSTKNYDKEFCDKLKNVYYNADKYFKEMSAIEQSSMVWFPMIKGHFDNIRSYLVAGSMMSQMISTTIDAIRQCCINTLAGKTSLF